MKIRWNNPLKFNLETYLSSQRWSTRPPPTVRQVTPSLPPPLSSHLLSSPLSTWHHRHLVLWMGVFKRGGEGRGGCPRYHEDCQVSWPTVGELLCFIRSLTSDSAEWGAEPQSLLLDRRSMSSWVLSWLFTEVREIIAFSAFINNNRISKFVGVRCLE